MSAAELRSDGRQAAHALARLVHGDLAGLFDGPSSVILDPDLPMVSLDLSRVNGSDTLLCRFGASPINEFGGIAAVFCALGLDAAPARIPA